MLTVGRWKELITALLQISDHYCTDVKKASLLGFLAGFVLMSVWAWVILCAPDFFSWNFTFLLLNAIQMLLLLYRIRPIKFCAELEELYRDVFQPLKVSR